MTLIINPSARIKKPVNLVVRPTPVCVVKNTTKQLSATVENSSNQEVLWTMVSGGGSINVSGLYTAPVATGTAMIRATASVDTTVTKDVVVNIKDTVAECCDPLIDIYPIEGAVQPGGTLQYQLYENGVEASPSGVTWSTSLGTITSGGLFVAPSTVTNGLAIATVTGLATNDCYDTSTVLVSNNKLSIEVNPPRQSVRVGQTATLLSSVIGTDNENVTWTLQQYYEQGSHPITLTPSGVPNVLVGAPSSLPTNPYVRVRATSAVNPALWDEGVVQILDAVLPIKTFPVTKYTINEACNTTTANETVYMESDGYKGMNSVLPKYSYGQSDGITKYAWPTGTSSSDFLWITAYDTVTVPPNSTTTSISLEPIVEDSPSDFTTSETMEWNRTFKVPEWSRLYFKIDDTCTITSPTAIFTQQDFSSLGSAITVVTGEVAYVEDTDSTSVGFVYTLNTGFFSGASGETFNPAASARDVVQLTANLNGVPHTITLYIRPEPDLPEVFPSLCGPYNADPYLYYPGESQLDFTSYWMTPVAFYDKLAQYMSSEEWKQRHQHCSAQCQIVPDWVGKEYNAKIPFALPRTCRWLDDATLPYASKYNRHDRWAYPIFMHYYHGKWACFVPATADASVSLSADGNMIVNESIPYEIKFEALKNRHYMSNEPDLIGPAMYPAAVKFEVVESTEQINLSPEFATRVAGVYPAKANIDTDDIIMLIDSTTNVAKYKINGSYIEGDPKITYVKVTPNIFEGTYTRSVIVPMFVCPQYVAHKMTGTYAGTCNTTYRFKYYGIHFMYNSRVYGSIGSKLISSYADDRSYINSNYVKSSVKIRACAVTRNRCAGPVFVKYASGGIIPVEGMASSSGVKPTTYYADRGYTVDDYSIELADQGTTCEFSITPYQYSFSGGSGSIKEDQNNQQWYFKPPTASKTSAARKISQGD